MNLHRLLANNKLVYRTRCLSSTKNCFIPESYRQNNKERKPTWYFPLFDDITITGHTQIEHDQKVKRFLKAKITLNILRSVTSVWSINVLGYKVSSRIIKPDPERLHPIKKATYSSRKLDISQKTTGHVCVLCKMDE